MNDRPNRTILANLVNDIMADGPTIAYCRAMAAVTPRKLWQAYPGDCVVMLAPCNTVFRDYVARSLDLDVDRVEIIAPTEVRAVHALDLAHELGATELISYRSELLPFVLDAPVIEFARRTGMRIFPYSALPEVSTLEAVRVINTKHGFRKIAESLGLPIAPGGYAETMDELRNGLNLFLRDYPAAIIKTNRASNGYGNTVIYTGSMTDIEKQIESSIAGQPERHCGWIYELYLPFTSVPSMEMSIDETGVHAFYSCDQRTVNNAWTGMVTPAEQRFSHPQLMTAAGAIGTWLRNHGYRGIFDVDSGTYNQGFVVTEANVRRTGGTYLEELARRLRPGDFPVHWRADARPGTSRMEFAQAVRALATAGMSDPKADARAILTADTLDVDGKWRYLVVGSDADSIAAVEQSVKRILGIG